MKPPTCALPENLGLELDKLNACIHCGMCLTACPTYMVTGSEAESPRGRLYLMRQLLEGKLDSPKQLSTHLDPCLGCLACESACPSGVAYGDLLMSSRESLVQFQPAWKRGIRRFFLKSVLPNPRLLSCLAFSLRLYKGLGFQALLRVSKLPGALGWFGKIEQFTPTIQPGKPLIMGMRFGENVKGKVALFLGCVMNAAYTQTQKNTVSVLILNGYEVYIPPQTCCGALAHHSGEKDILESLSRQNIDLMLAENPDWIVVNAAGCGATLKEYHHLLAHHPHAKTFQIKVVDVMELLAQHPLQGTPRLPEISVTYHAACHLHHAQGIQQQPYQLLQQISGIKLVPLWDAEMCCGSAGVYNLAHPDLSAAILAEKMTHLEKTKAQVVLAANPGCMLQLEAGIQSSGILMRVMHPVDLIASAYKNL